MSALLLLLIIFLIVMSILKNNPSIAEYWTRTYSRSYVETWAKLNANFPFSITEVSLIIVVISCVVFLAWGFSLLGNKKVWPFIHRLLMVSIIIVGTITMYNASVGMAYNRKPLEIEKYKGEIKKEDFKAIATYYVNDLNACAEQLEFTEEGEIVLPYKQSRLIEKLRSEFTKLNSDYFHDYVPYGKAVTFSPIMTSVGIVGIYFGVLGEANYNTYSTNAEKPFYIMHEMCHGVGVMREDDAQLLSTYLSIDSDDPLIRYSCYYNTIDRILDIARLTDNPNDYNEVKGLISDKVWKNYAYIYERWKGKMFLADFGDKINDWYLKTFGQKQGTNSYEDTDTEVDPGGKVITLSNYQSIYFKNYYDKMS